MSIFKWGHAGLFVGGMLFATKGIEILSTEKAHEIYVKVTAAALRGRDEVMENVTMLREGCEDIYAEAEQMNEERAGLPEVSTEVIEDKSSAKKPAKKTAKKAGK